MRLHVAYATLECIASPVPDVCLKYHPHSPYEAARERFLGQREHDHDAQRVVAGHRLMQAASDIFLGWSRVEEPAGA